MKIRFSSALQKARVWARGHEGSLPAGTTLVRDLYGRIRVALPPGPALPPNLVELATELNPLLGPYGPGAENIFLIGDQLVAPAAIFDSQDRVPLDAGSKSGAFFLDRVVTGADWIRPQFQERGHAVARATFYGLKGGVGRSTALALFARHVAARGKKVLVLDLDLESPGIGSLLLPLDRFPTSGIVDWFVEDAVGAADDELLEQLTAISPLSTATLGEIRVAPAYGSDEKSYVPKLSRVTLDVRRPGEMETFSARLHRLLEQLEEHYRPDLVLLDSRAGLHDVAAVAITRVGALALLFAANGDQTWEGYRLLFRHWQHHFGVLPSFRDNLRVVDALVPETGRVEHRQTALLAAHRLFEETIYEEASAEMTDAFNFDLNDADAPHFSIPILWSRVFQGFNPSGSTAVSDAEIAASYGEFLESCDRLLFPG